MRDDLAGISSDHVPSSISISAAQAATTFPREAAWKTVRRVTGAPDRSSATPKVSIHTGRPSRHTATAAPRTRDSSITARVKSRSAPGSVGAAGGDGSAAATRPISRIAVARNA